MDGKVTSSSINNNNPGTDFMNQLKKFENNEDISEKNIKDKDFYYKEMMKSQGIYYAIFYLCDSLIFYLCDSSN